MKKALFIFLLLGSSQVFAQDEDLSALETAIEEDTVSTDVSTPPRTRIVGKTVTDTVAESRPLEAQGLAAGKAISGTFARMKC